MEQPFPISSIEWDAILDANSTIFLGHNIDFLRRKYAAMHQKKIPTDLLNMPPEVSMAKWVKFLIREKVKIGDAT